MLDFSNASLRKSVIALAGIACLAGMAQANAADPVVLSFATVGDSRQDPVTQDVSQQPLSQQDATWLQNSKAWSRIIRTIQSQKANMLFFNGDMIMGYGTADPATVTSANVASSDFYKYGQQYAFWRGMVAPLMETGTYVVPVAGNHELQCKSCGKIAKQQNEVVWRSNMGDLIIDQSRFSNLLGSPVQNFNVANHPNIGDPISPLESNTISTDQSQLSFSFDFNGSHFAIVNTDAVGNDSRAPATWLANDLAAAASHGATHFFVFGHKPAYTYQFDPTNPKISGLDANPNNQKAFWDVIEQYHATYFCGHEHVFNMMQPRLNDSTTPGTAYQVLVGSGGSPFESPNPAAVTASPNDRKYAWAYVRVFQSGKVQIDAYGFDANYGPTTLLQSVTLTQ